MSSMPARVVGGQASLRCVPRGGRSARRARVGPSATATGHNRAGRPEAALRPPQVPDGGGEPDPGAGQKQHKKQRGKVDDHALPIVDRARPVAKLRGRGRALARTDGATRVRPGRPVRAWWQRNRGTHQGLAGLPRPELNHAVIATRYDWLLIRHAEALHENVLILSQRTAACHQKPAVQPVRAPGWFRGSDGNRLGCGHRRRR